MKFVSFAIQSASSGLSVSDITDVINPLNQVGSAEQDEIPSNITNSNSPTSDLGTDQAEYVNNMTRNYYYNYNNDPYVPSHDYYHDYYDMVEGMDECFALGYGVMVIIENTPRGV